MRKVYIAGTGMTPFCRHLDKTHDQLTAMSVLEALGDTGCEPKDVDLAIYSNVSQGAMANEQVVRGQLALRKLGFSRIPMFNVENACASSTTALNIAYNYIGAGLADVALVIGTEKLFNEDRARRFAVFNQKPDMEQATRFLERYKDRLIEAPRKESPYELGSVLMECYAAQARLHMKRFGTTQQQLAVVASKNHGHAVHNPLAQYRNAMSVDEVLAGKIASWPLTVPMCSPIVDGSTAAILCSKDALKLFPYAHPVKILASIMITGSDRDPADDDNHATRLASRKAYEVAGIGPRDISVIELHDACAFSEIAESEALGLCRPGEGGAYAESGASTLGGRQPINPSGGLESKGHPLAATGLGQIHHLVAQLRGTAGACQVDKARIALAHNGGGFIGVEEAVACVTILGCA